MMSGPDSAIVCLRICVVANGLLAAVKLFAGIVGNSRALVADGINSLVDVISSVVAWVGNWISHRPPDRGHPYGHGNADVLAALFVGVVVFSTGIFVAEHAWTALRGGGLHSPTLLPVIVAAGVIIAKMVLYKYTFRVAQLTRSPAVYATAIDHKSDVLATSGALIGIFAARIGWPILDPLAALWVAALIMYHAIRILYDNVYILMSGQPDAAMLDPIKQTLTQTAAVKGLHHTRARTLGSKFIIYAEILVDGTLSVYEGHEVAGRARRAVLERHPEVQDVIVHVEPLETFRAALEGVNSTE
jgi:cation diffusion facilitator family transporter